MTVLWKYVSNAICIHLKWGVHLRLTVHFNFLSVHVVY